MKKFAFFITSLFVTLFSCQMPDKKTAPQEVPPTGLTAIAIHGGAGNLKKMKLTAEEEAAYLATLDQALSEGKKILDNGGSSIDAVEAAIHILEDSPLFNAGKGSVFSHDGKNEMDAAIMNGSDLSCGAVAGVTGIRNPISAARRVMEKSDFILLSGQGAEEFARSQGLPFEDASYFFTEKRWKQLQEALAEDSVQLDHDKSGQTKAGEGKFGTVGCVALDKNGNLAAGTSTGGLTNKRYNRIGDSPLIGAGTYASNATCAVSCTGKGEDFIRLGVAHEISSIIRYRNSDLQAALDDVILQQLDSIGGRGGCIAVNPRGEIAMAFTTTGMFRASVDASGRKTLKIYKE